MKKAELIKLLLKTAEIIEYYIPTQMISVDGELMNCTMLANRIKSELSTEWKELNPTE